VACDGIKQRPGVRPTASTFGTTVDNRPQPTYLWLGTEKLFGPFQYIFQPTEAGWIWLHCYYLDEHRSTCVVEWPAPDLAGGSAWTRSARASCLTRLEEIFHRQPGRAPADQPGGRDGPR